MDGPECVVALWSCVMLVYRELGAWMDYLKGYCEEKMWSHRGRPVDFVIQLMHQDTETKDVSSATNDALVLWLSLTSQEVMYMALNKQL